MTSIRIRIEGDPIPQGSMKFYGKGRVTHSDPRLKTWRELIRLNALNAARQAGWELPYDGPVHIAATFRLAKPKSVKRDTPSVKPDLDKLTRAVGDALSPRRGPKVLTDDSRIIAIDASKKYATPTNPVGLTLTITPQHLPF